jgi:hypothetical protein
VKSKSNPKTSVEKQFFEIANWKKAQSRMKCGGNDWLKLYTSLLEHDGFGGMDDSSRMLIVALWLYAARTGLYIFPADPKWIARKIPMLNNSPDLEPLLNAADCYGNPTPFIAYCDPPKAKKANKDSKSCTPAKKIKKSKKEKSRTEESRVEQKKSLRVSGEENRGNKERISTAPEHTSSAQQAEAPESEKSENTIDPEAGSAKRHIVPKPIRSVFRRGSPQSIGSVIGEWFPSHWQDPDAESFGWEIVWALGYSDDRENLKARSEWGSFASWWSRIKKAAPAAVLDGLRTKAIRKAVYLRTKGKSTKNRSAVWFHIMNGELSQRGVTMTQSARASPLR